MAITKKDLASIKKAIDEAVTKDLTLKQMNKLPTLSGLSKDGEEMVASITPEELAALKALYWKAKELGASNKDLHHFAPIH